VGDDGSRRRRRLADAVTGGARLLIDAGQADGRGAPPRRARSAPALGLIATVADTSASGAIADWTPLTAVQRGAHAVWSC